MTGYITMNEFAPTVVEIIEKAGKELATTIITEAEFLSLDNMERGFYLVTPSAENTTFPKNNNHLGLIATVEQNNQLHRIIILIDQLTADIYTRSQSFTKEGTSVNETDWRSVISFDELPITDSATIGGSNITFSAEGAKLLNNTISDLQSQVQNLIDNPSSGSDGADGKSAYEIAVDNGYVGSETEWLNSLKGETGEQGLIGVKGDDGVDGESAYQVAVTNGFIGTEVEWLNSLKGEKGDKGDKGDNGDHVNIDVLNKLTENINGELEYDGNPLSLKWNVFEI